MDVQREGVRRGKIIKRSITGVILLVVVVLTSVWLSRLKPAAPSVERSTVWMDTVKRGPFLRQVRGLGTLVPEEILFIPATNEGRVERILVRPGAQVTAQTVLLVLSNPELELAAVEAEYQVKAAEARNQDLNVQLNSQNLNQRAEVARLQSEYVRAKLQADRDELLSKDGLIPDIELKLSQTIAGELSNRHQIEEEKQSIQGDSAKAQLAVQQAEVNRLQALYELRLKHVEDLNIRAGASGVLQELELEIGQQVAAGTILAKVVQPTRLKAELRIPETQAKDVQIGQKALIDTRNGIIPGAVARIDPAVREGTVTVDVRAGGRSAAGRQA